MKLPHFAVSNLFMPHRARASRNLRRRLAGTACALAAILPFHVFATNASAKELTSAQAAVDQLPPSATLRKIVENGSIVLGIRESSVPFSYLNKDQQPVGYSYSIALKVVDDIKRRLNLPTLSVKNVMVTSSNRISYVVNNQVDLECGSTAHLSDRDPLVAFSNSFFMYGIRMAVKKKSGIRNYDDLAGKTVATTAGTSDERLLRQMSMQKKLNLRIIAARDHAEAFAALKSDRAVAFVMDDPLLRKDRAGRRGE